MMETAPRTYPLGWSSEPGESTEPSRLPTREEFRKIKLARCRLKLVAERTKALASAVYAEFGAASRPVLASKGLTVADDGTIVSAEEEEVDRDWIAIVAGLDIAGVKYPLPHDTHINPATGCVEVVPHSHEGYGASADGPAGGRTAAPAVHA
jgi:hypothetical protein